jgi:drug/metabolite transporter (DMT)-like permease
MFRNITVGQAMFGAAVTSLIMGGFVVVSRFGVSNLTSAADLTFFRYLSGLILLPVFLKRPIRNLGGIGWGRGVVIMILAGWCFNLVMMSGFKYAPAAHGAIFTPGTLPMFTALYSYFLFKERLSMGRITGLMVLMGGLVTLGWGGLIESSPDAWKGDLLFLAASACWAAFTVSIRYWNIDPVYGVSVVAVLSLVCFTPIYIFYFGSPFLDLPIGGIVLQLIYQGVFVGVIAVVLFTICIPVIGPARTALFMALVPVFGTLLGALILDEIPGTIEFGGIVLVIFGMLAAMGMPLKRNKS